MSCAAGQSHHSFLMFYRTSLALFLLHLMSMFHIILLYRLSYTKHFSVKFRTVFAISIRGAYSSIYHEYFLSEVSIFFLDLTFLFPYDTVFSPVIIQASNCQLSCRLNYISIVLLVSIFHFSPIFKYLDLKYCVVSTAHKVRPMCEMNLFLLTECILACELKSTYISTGLCYDNHYNAMHFCH